MANDAAGFFGGLDADAVGTNPFYTADSVYPIVCVDASLKTKEDGNKQFVISWSIDDPSSEYHGNRLSQYFSKLDFPSDPKAAQKFWDGLSAQEKKSQKFLNLLLQEGFGLSVAEIKKLDLNDLIGREAMGKVVNSTYTDKTTGEEKKSTNLREVTSKAQFQANRDEAEKGSLAKFGI